MKNEVALILQQYHRETQGLSYDRKLELTLVLEKYNRWIDTFYPEYFFFWNRRKYWEFILSIQTITIFGIFFRMYQISDINRIRQNYLNFINNQCKLCNISKPESIEWCEEKMLCFLKLCIEEYNIIAYQDYIISSRPGDEFYTYCRN